MGKNQQTVGVKLPTFQLHWITVYFADIKSSSGLPYNVDMDYKRNKK